MNKRKIGSAYEGRAAAFLEEKGYRIMMRNYRCRFGEIDLIAQQGETLIFCEVKFRKSSDYGGPLSAVGTKKQQTIYRCAQCFLMEFHVGEVPCRFDVIGITPEEILHIENAFGG